MQRVDTHEGGDAAQKPLQEVQALRSDEGCLCHAEAFGGELYAAYARANAHEQLRVGVGVRVRVRVRVSVCACVFSCGEKENGR